jgi:hypothetical protein
MVVPLLVTEARGESRNLAAASSSATSSEDLMKDTKRNEVSCLRERWAIGVKSEKGRLAWRRRSAPLRRAFVATLVAIVASVLGLVGSRVFALLESSGFDDLGGAVIRPEELVRDEQGRLEVESLRLPLDTAVPRSPSARVVERGRRLREMYDRTVGAGGKHSFPARVGPSPPEANAPLAMDSGDPNPDGVSFRDAPL